ncbi:MAG: serine/threonine protein kinase [Verrucomicrobiales bacterium]
MDERYQVKGKIGQGGIGAVYRAFDTSLKREVAIKRLLPDDGTPEAERNTSEVITKEAGMLSKVQHSNIVTVYDVGVDDDGGYVVMELIDGETFDVTVGRGALTAADFSEVVDQTLEAMIAAQEIGMLHRDIKPSNVMVTWLPSGRFQVKVLDFGLAKLSQTPTLQTVNHGDSIMGSIYFMSPEQFDREPLDARTDLYSLGCLYYYGLSGSYPFDAENAAGVMIAHIEHDVIPLENLRPDLPREVCDWVMRLISKEADARPSSAVEAQREFEPALAAIRAAANPKPGGVAVVKPEKPQGPTRPQLITGPVDPTRRYAVPQHTTTQQHYQKAGRSPATAIFIWSLVALAAIAAFWLYLRGQIGSTTPPPPPDAPEAAETPIATETPPTPKEVRTAAAPAAKRPLPIRTDTRGGHPPQRLVSVGSAWSYWDQDVNQNNWYRTKFNDQHWPRGKSPLGFGDDQETVIRKEGGDAPPRITYYFRKKITVKNAPQSDDPGMLVAKIQYDDGFRMYLNEVEVLREGLPQEGEIYPKTLGKNRGNEQQEAKYVKFEILPTKLKEGENLFAVEVHQTNLTSSDLRFSMILDYEKEKKEPKKEKP